MKYRTIMSYMALPIFDLAESVQLHSGHETCLGFGIDIYVYAISPPGKVDLEAVVFPWRISTRRLVQR